MHLITQHAQYVIPLTPQMRHNQVRVTINQTTLHQSVEALNEELKDATLSMNPWGDENHESPFFGFGWWPWVCTVRWSSGKLWFQNWTVFWNGCPPSLGKTSYWQWSLKCNQWGWYYLIGRRESTMYPEIALSSVQSRSRRQTWMNDLVSQIGWKFEDDVNLIPLTDEWEFCGVSEQCDAVGAEDSWLEISQAGMKGTHQVVNFIKGVFYPISIMNFLSSLEIYVRGLARIVSTEEVEAGRRAYSSLLGCFTGLYERKQRNRQKTPPALSCKLYKSTSRVLSRQ